MIAPYVEEMAKTYKGRLQVGKLDIDNNQRVAQQFEIRSIPTLLLFRGGKVVGQLCRCSAQGEDGAVHHRQARPSGEPACSRPAPLLSRPAEPLPGLSLPPADEGPTRPATRQNAISQIS